MEPAISIDTEDLTGELLQLGGLLDRFKQREEPLWQESVMSVSASVAREECLICTLDAHFLREGTCRWVYEWIKGRTVVAGS